MKAFVLAAGYGKRMGDLTAERPKPLLPLNGHPLIFYTLFQLYRWGVSEAMINLHYLGAQIEAALRDFPHFRLHFSHEARLLGTAGGLRRGIELGFLGPADWCLIANPDALLHPQPADAPPDPATLGGHLDGLLYLKPLDPQSPATGFSFSNNGPTKDLIHISESGQYYYIGYGLVRAASVAHLADGDTVELRPVWRTSGERGRLKGRRFQGAVHDVGTRESYETFRNAGPAPVPADSEDQWRAFLKGWAEAAD